MEGGQNPEELDELEPDADYWKAQNPLPNLHIAVSDEFLKDWIKGYQSDRSFQNIWRDLDHEGLARKTGGRFIKDAQGLLYFVDPDYQPRLCVPSSQRNFILREAHENPMESSHTGPERLWQQLSQKFYWKRMKVDVLAFACSCDTCQKTKVSNFNKFGFLIPNPIPSRPYQLVSMDFMVNLPWSGEYNAIFIVVDRLKSMPVLSQQLQASQLKNSGGSMSNTSPAVLDFQRVSSPIGILDGRPISGRASPSTSRPRCPCPLRTTRSTMARLKS